MDPSGLKAGDFDRDTKGEKIWVVTDSMHPIGFISVWEPENFIHNLFVHPKLFGRGIGTALLKECLQNIGRPAALKCSETNSVAKDFYLSKGWRVVSDGSGPDGKYLLMHYEDTVYKDIYLDKIS